MNRSNRGSLHNLKGITNDLIANLAILLLCHIIFTGFLMQDDISVSWSFAIAGIYLTVYLLVGLSCGLYDMSTFFYSDRLVRRVTFGCLAATSFVLFFFYFTGQAHSNRSFYTTYLVLCYEAHMVSAFLAYRMNRRINGAKRTLLIGTKAEFEKFNRYITKTSLPFNLVGYVKYETEGTEDELTEEYLGHLDKGDLEKIIREMVIDQVYLMRTQGMGESVRACTDICVDLGVETRLVLPLDRDDCSMHISSIGNYPVVSYHINSQNPGMSFVKRAIDIIGALVGLIISSPVILGAGVLIKLDSPGPVFFKQTRVGRNGRRFKIYKLRTMSKDAETQKSDLLDRNEMGGSGVIFKIKDDPRITKVGAFLRKTSIDELPQFLNVLKGDMSLVGTRPPTEDEVKEYECMHWRRLRIKPGITGLWQISGRNSINSFDEIVELDVQYIANWTIVTDLRILLSTIAVVLKQKDAY